MKPPQADDRLPRDEAAHQRALPAASALHADALIPINIDLPRAIANALAALPAIRALRPRMLRELPELDLRQLDELETYALATRHAHSLYVAAQAAPDALSELTTEATALRDTLYTDAVALATLNLVRGESLKRFRLNVGYKTLALDLLGLAALLRRSLPDIASKTPIHPSELTRATALGEALATAVQAREQTLRLIAKAAEQRQRLFTLFVRAYDQVRRAVTYLRWDEGDVEAIAPSLYAGRRRRVG